MPDRRERLPSAAGFLFCCEACRNRLFTSQLSSVKHGCISFDGLFVSALRPGPALLPPISRPRLSANQRIEVRQVVDLFYPYLRRTVLTVVPQFFPSSSVDLRFRFEIFLHPAEDRAALTESAKNQVFFSEPDPLGRFDVLGSPPIPPQLQINRWTTPTVVLFSLSQGIIEGCVK